MIRSLLRRPRSVRVPLANGPVDIQKVEVKKVSKPILSNFATTFIIGFFIIRTTDYLFSTSTNDDKNPANEKPTEPTQPIKRSEKFSEHWKRQHEQISTSQNTSVYGGNHMADKPGVFHLMLPIWIREKELPMYKETDTEWQAFAKLQEDKKKMVEIKREVAKMIGKQIQKPQHIVNLRHIQFSRQIAVLLEVVPPIYPPHAYEVPCLFIDSSEVKFGWRVLPDSTGSRVERIFHPIIFAEAFAVGVKEFALATFLITRARILDRINETKIVSYKVDHKNGSPPLSTSIIDQQASEEDKAKLRFPTTRASDRDMKVLLPFLRGQFGEESSRQKYRDLVKSMTYQTAIEHACATFNTAWLSRQFAALQNTPRGACQVRGFVDCIGARGKYRLEVMAIYLPSENAFVGRPVILGAFVIADLPKWSGKGEERLSKSPSATDSEVDKTTQSNPAQQPPSDKSVEK